MKFSYLFIRNKPLFSDFMRLSLPALGNEFIAMIKETSLASTFFVPELMTAYKTVQSSTFLSVESLMISGLIYLVINFALSRLVKLLEKRLRASDR